MNNVNNKLILNILFIFFIIQQIGYSFHLSFGSLGLLLTTFFFFKNYEKIEVQRSIYISATIIISLLINMTVQSSTADSLQALRFAFNCFLLFLLLNNNRYLYPPSRYLFVLTCILLAIIGLYQIFIDPTFQIDSDYFAMGENLGSYSEGLSKKNVELRTNGIYSESSYYGLILCCLYVLTLNSNEYFSNYQKLFLVFLLVLMILFIGSGIGLLGLVLFTFDYIYRNIKKININFFIVAIFSFFVGFSIFSYLLDSDVNFSIMNRIIVADLEGDESANTRFLGPLQLILFEIKNYMFFGVPTNTYNYFLITGLYQTTADFPMHNGIMNLIIWFGIFGFFQIYCISMRLKNFTEFLIVILIGFQNGNFYSYEKVFSILYIIFILRSISKSKI